jgi:hypothetical protein
MNALTNDEFAARVLELAKPGEHFSPTAYYDHDGDCIEFLARPENFYAERIDDLVTVYYSEETGEIVGSLLKGVTALCKKLLERLPGFKIEIQHDKVKLVHIFRAKLWASEVNPDKLATVTYQKLIDTYLKLIAVASESGVEVDLKRAA